MLTGIDVLGVSFYHHSEVKATMARVLKMTSQQILLRPITSLKYLDVL